VTTEADGLSGIVDCGGGTLSAILMSTAWTAAGLSFQASLSASSTFFNVFGSTGDEVTYTTTGNGNMITFDPALWIGIRFLKVRSGTSGTPVAQAAARSVTCLLQAIGTLK
jgi:hypothetical protein